MDRIGLWPVGNPSEITLMQCCGYMQTGILRVLCMFFDHGIPYAYPKGFRKVHVQATYWSLWISFGLGNTGTIMYAGTMRAREKILINPSLYVVNID